MSYKTRKSDTHEERYVHFFIDGSDRVHRATLFARRGANEEQWRATVAFCAHGDQFQRNVGRNTARRRFFASPKDRYVLSDWTHQAAMAIVQRAYWHLFGNGGIVRPLPL